MSRAGCSAFCFVALRTFFSDENLPVLRRKSPSVRKKAKALLMEIEARGVLKAVLVTAHEFHLEPQLVFYDELPDGELVYSRVGPPASL